VSEWKRTTSINIKIGVIVGVPLTVAMAWHMGGWQWGLLALGACLVVTE